MQESLRRGRKGIGHDQDEQIEGEPGLRIEEAKFWRRIVVAVAVRICQPSYNITTVYQNCGDSIA